MAKEQRDQKSDEKDRQASRKSKPGDKRIGKLPRRYKFLLNPFPETRLSSCPRCNRLTYPRKFPLFIHVDGYGPYTQGKTCKYCPKCEIIICHQDELEFEMASAFEKIDPTVMGNDYMVMGTVQVKVWKASMAHPIPLEELLAHTADFKGYLDLQFDPGGWRHKDAGPRYLEPRPPNTPWRAARADRKTGAAPGGLPSPGHGAAAWF